jgi:membrane protease YdiL (CAAX protease family)
VFGIAHLLNISSLGIDLMILQVGYSFLMGMMWSVMFLRTRNLWMVILMHASYNFFGQVLFTMGTVNQRFDMLTIWITVLLAILVAIHTVIQLFYIRLENLNISGFEVRSS